MAAFAEGSAGTLRVGTYQSVGARPAAPPARVHGRPGPTSRCSSPSRPTTAASSARRARASSTSPSSCSGRERPFETVGADARPVRRRPARRLAAADRPKPPSLREVAAMPLIGNRNAGASTRSRTASATPASSRASSSARRQRHHPGACRRGRRRRARPAPDRRPVPSGTVVLGSERRAATQDRHRLAPRPLPLPGRARLRRARPGRGRRRGRPVRLGRGRLAQARDAAISTARSRLSSPSILTSTSPRSTRSVLPPAGHRPRRTLGRRSRRRRREGHPRSRAGYGPTCTRSTRVPPPTSFST